MDKIIYIKKEVGKAEELIDMMTNHEALHTDIKEIFEDEYLINTERLQKENAEHGCENEFSDFITMILSETYTCSHCGCHTNNHGYVYRNNGGCIGRSSGCIICNRLSDIEYYKMIDKNKNYKNILEGQGVIGSHKDLIDSFNILKDYCNNLFEKLYNVSSQHIEHLELSLNNSTKEVKYFIDEIQKVLLEKYDCSLIYVDLIANVHSDYTEIIFDFGYDKYVVENNVSANTIIDELYKVAKLMCCVENCA